MLPPDCPYLPYHNDIEVPRMRVPSPYHFPLTNLLILTTNSEKHSENPTHPQTQSGSLMHSNILLHRSATL